MSRVLQHACTFLFVPGDRPERFAKALASGADAVILDLEDALAPVHKPQAREAIGAAWATFDAAARARCVVRINPVGTPWHDDDCAWVRSLSGLGAVMLPKAEQVADVRRVAQHAPVIALIETALGLSQVRVLTQAAANAAAPAPDLVQAQVQPQVQVTPPQHGLLRLALGHIDLQADLGMACGPEESELNSVRFELVLASRLARMPAPIDGVTMDTRERTRCSEDALRARRWGFGGKLCIHPAQVPWTRQAFAPSAQELAWAQRVVHAVAQAQGGVCTVDHKMVDAPVLKLAEQTLMRAGI